MDGRARARRTIGAAVCLSPALLAAASLGYGFASAQAARPGVLLAGLAAAVGLLNMWSSYGRAWLHLARGRDPRAYRHSSGLPLIGTVLCVCACLASFGSVPTAVLALVAFAIDTGGSPWFLAATWNDESLWSGS